ncbi:MAG: acetate kinase [Propionibacteriaceae bacterium]|nr:acetate kinase [Propionibacteriaceae bacterium]
MSDSRPILVLNCGSSSVKYQMIDVATGDVMAKGLAERIGQAEGVVTHTVGGEDFTVTTALPDHSATLAVVVDLFHKHGPDIDSAVAVAHRVVHGGEKFRAPTLIDDAAIAAIEEVSPLAPLHNPPALQGIRAAQAVLPDVPQVAIFDTAFFSTIPAEAYTYALPTELAHRLGIRKYGFHGTSHSYVSAKVAEILGTPGLRQIVCHLGNGSSVSAVNDGVAIENSMGFTPLPGLVMGTRTGDLDPSIIAYICQQTGQSVEQVDNLLGKQSGLLGMTGHSDMRDVSDAAEAGDAQAILTLDVYAHRLVMYIAGYHVLLGGAQAITFTAGIGENAAGLRSMICARLACLGVKLDEAKNAERSREARIISSPDSAITVLVVPTNEELSMANQTAALLDK